LFDFRLLQQNRRKAVVNAGCYAHLKLADRSLSRCLTRERQLWPLVCEQARCWRKLTLSVHRSEQGADHNTFEKAFPKPSLFARKPWCPLLNEMSDTFFEIFRPATGRDFTIGELGRLGQRLAMRERKLLLDDANGPW
jgi:hypothetical protein